MAATKLALEMTERPVSGATLVAAQEMVVADAATSSYTVTGPAPGAGVKRWAVKREDSSGTSANIITVSFLNATGTVTTRALSTISETMTFRAVGTSGFRVESGFAPRGVEGLNVVAASGTALTLPAPTAATMNRVLLTGNCAFTFPSPVVGQSFNLALRQDSTGSRVPTWPSTVAWPNGVAPTLSRGPGMADRLFFQCVDAGIWEGFVTAANIRPFDPSAVPGLFLWLEADQLAGTAQTLPAEGTAVAQWNDMSGNANHFVQATAGNRPTFHSTGSDVALLNGNPAVTFDGVNNYLQCATLPTNTPQTTTFIVGAYRSSGGAIQTFIGSTVNGGLEIDENNGVLRMNTQGTAAIGASGAGALTPDVAQVAYTTYDSVGGVWAVYGNGAATSGTNVQTFAASSVTLLGLNGGASGPAILKGPIAAVIQYGRVLTSTERVQVGKYLTRKYGVTGVGELV